MTSPSPLANDFLQILNRDPALDDPFRPILSEDPNLPKFLDDSEKSTYWYKPWEGPVEELELIQFYLLLRDGEKGVFMIEEVGNKAVSMLTRAFPDLDLAFIHRHMARSVTDDVRGKFIRVAHDIQVQPLSINRREPECSSGLHFDGHCVPSTVGGIHSLSNGSTDLAFSFMGSPFAFSGGYRNETLVKHGETWHRASTRISCCLLEPDLCELPSNLNKAQETWLTEYRPGAVRQTSPPVLGQYKRSRNDTDVPNTTKGSIR